MNAGMKKRAVAMWLTSLLLAVQLFGSGQAFAAAASDLSAWSAATTVTVGDTGAAIDPALNFTTGRTEQETLTSDLVVEQRGSDYYMYSYTGGFIDLGTVDMAQVPPLSGPWQGRITAVPGHVYLYSSDNLAAKVAVVKAAMVVLAAEQVGQLCGVSRLPVAEKYHQRPQLRVEGAGRQPRLPDRIAGIHPQQLGQGDQPVGRGQRLPKIVSPQEVPPRREYGLLAFHLESFKLAGQPFVQPGRHRFR
jgi:hypothetical protein